MDLDLFKSISKYPFIHNAIFFDSNELRQNKTCIDKCKEKDCLKRIENTIKTEFLCAKGYNNIQLSINGFKVIINGLIYNDNKIIPQGRKDVRKEWFVIKEVVDLFVNKIIDLENHINKSILEATEKNFSMFHDFKTSMSVFFNCTQDIISKLPGETFIEKLDNSDKSFKDLYNALELITSQLRMIDVVLNPKSIEFGNKKRVNLYRLFEKIKILFNHLSAKRQEININLISEGWVNDCYCYESIEFIPLILLDNALKYSVSDSDIEIKFEQRHKTLKVIVKNIGPLVKDENESKIFNKFFRDESAISFSKEGMGMGLWIAQEILVSHGSKLFYFKDRKEIRPFGLNVFEFDIATIE